MKPLKIVIFSLVFVFLFTTILLAQVNVRGYNRSDGTYVQPHQRSAPNDSVTDNYSFKGNVNPHTGQEGTNYYRHNPSSPYYDGSSRKSKGLFD